MISVKACRTPEAAGTDASGRGNSHKKRGYMYQNTLIVGYVGRDAELRYTAQGVAQSTFSVAVDKVRKNGADKVKETTWFRVTVWDKAAENMSKYIRKGALVLVEGKFNQDKETGGPRVWVDKESNSRASYELSADTLQILKFVDDGQESAPAPVTDDMPF